MKDNNLFYTVIRKFGLIDQDVHFKGSEHLFSTQIGGLNTDWEGLSTFADLTHVKKKERYLRKACESAKNNKKGLHLFLLLNDMHKEHYDYIFRTAKALHFFSDKPYVLVVYQGETQGIPLLYRLEMLETDIDRIHFLNRTLICDF